MKTQLTLLLIFCLSIISVSGQTLVDWKTQKNNAFSQTGIAIEGHEASFSTQILKKDNQFKVFNYGQWDGYPAGQGKDILNLLSSQNIKKLSDNLEHVEYVSDAPY